MLVDCKQCSGEFKTYPAWIKKGGGIYCSRKCMGESRKGRATYTRTPIQKQKMSEIIKQGDLTAQRERFIKMNSQRKGKTIEQIFGEKAMKIRQLRKQQVGQKNPNWKGGKDRNKYPYVFYKLRAKVLERDNYTCLNCDMTDETARLKDSLGRGLTVHHIDYDKENNDLSNLATTCKWCNSKANGGREKWIVHYHALLS